MVSSVTCRVPLKASQGACSRFLQPAGISKFYHSLRELRHAFLCWRICSPFCRQTCIWYRVLILLYCLKTTHRWLSWLLRRKWRWLDLAFCLRRLACQQARITDQINYKADLNQNFNFILRKICSVNLVSYHEWVLNSHWLLYLGRLLAATVKASSTVKMLLAPTNPNARWDLLSWRGNRSPNPSLRSRLKYKLKKLISQLLMMQSFSQLMIWITFQRQPNSKRPLKHKLMFKNLLWCN